MTVPSSTAKSGPYLCNGVTDIFNYDFRIVDKAHLNVILADANGVETTLTLTTHYTVSDVGSDTGSINLTSAGLALAVSGTTLTILRNPPFTQETDLQNQGAYLAQTVEDRFDLSVMQIQTLKEKLDRAIVIPASDDSTTGDELSADLARLADSADNIDTVAANVADVNTNADNIVAINTAATNIDAIIAAPAAADRAETAAAGVNALVAPADLTVLKAQTAERVTPGTSIEVLSSPGRFRVLAGSAASNGYTADGVVIVENDDGDTTFVRDAWLERGEVNVLWFEPYLDRTSDSAIALQSWLTRATALATDDKPATAIVPPGVKLLSGTPLTFGSNLHFFGGVSAVGGGEIAAHGDLPLSASLLSNINLPVAGERKEKNIRFVNLVVDGEARKYPAWLSNPDTGEAIVDPEKDYYDASTNPTGWIGNPSYDADDDSLVTSLSSPSGTLTLNGALVSGGAATIDPVRRVTITSAQNYAGKTFSITGTDFDGNAQTEDIKGPNATTVTGTKHWKTITEITINSPAGGSVKIGTNKFDIFGVVASKRRDGDAPNTRGYLVRLQGVENPVVEGCTFKNHGSFSLVYGSCKGGIVRKSRWDNCGRIDTISPSILAAHNGKHRLILSITKASPAIVTLLSPYPDMADGEAIHLRDLNNYTALRGSYKAKNPSGSTFELYEEDGVTPVDTSALSPYLFNGRGFVSNPDPVLEEDTLVEDCLFTNLKRIAVHIGGDRQTLRNNTVLNGGEGGFFAPFCVDATFENNRVDTINITDITANGFEIEGTGLRATGNRASFVDACGINCHGMFDGKIDDNWIYYAFKNSNLKYPYGPFSERHSFGVGSAPIAGQAVEPTAPLDARSHDKFPLSGSISHNVIGDSRGFPYAPDAAIYLGRAGTDQKMVKNLNVVGNDLRGYPNPTIELQDNSIDADTVLIRDNLPAPDGYGTGQLDIVNLTEGRALGLGESGTLFTNSGATALVALSLPLPKKGLRYGAYVLDGDGIRFTVPGAALVRVGSSTGSTNVTSNTVGDVIWLVCDGTNWLAVDYSGTWTPA